MPVFTHNKNVRSSLCCRLCVNDAFQISKTQAKKKWLNERRKKFSHNHQITCHATHRWFHNITFSLFIFTFPLQSNFHMTCGKNLKSIIIIASVSFLTEIWLNDELLKWSEWDLMWMLGTVHKWRVSDFEWIKRQDRRTVLFEFFAGDADRKCGENVSDFFHLPL